IHYRHDRNRGGWGSSVGGARSTPRPDAPTCTRRPRDRAYAKRGQTPRCWWGLGGGWAASPQLPPVQTPGGYSVCHAWSVHSRYHARYSMAPTPQNTYRLLLDHPPRRVGYNHPRHAGRYLITRHDQTTVLAQSLLPGTPVR